MGSEEVEEERERLVEGLDVLSAGVVAGMEIEIS